MKSIYIIKIGGLFSGLYRVVDEKKGIKIVNILIANYLFDYIHFPFPSTLRFILFVPLTHLPSLKTRALE